MGAVNVVAHHLSSGFRRCRVQDFTGCSGSHLASYCSKLRGLSLDIKRRALAASRLCLFCLRHPVNIDCYYKGSPSKPTCSSPGCEGEHAASVHEVLVGASTSVSLVTNEEGECEDEMYVNIERAGDEEDKLQDPDNSWLELEAGENEDNGGAGSSA